MNLFISDVKAKGFYTYSIMETVVNKDTKVTYYAHLTLRHSVVRYNDVKADILSVSLNILWKI